MDWIAVMTYDFHGHWDKKTGHVAPMYYHPQDDYDYFNMVSLDAHRHSNGYCHSAFSSNWYDCVMTLQRRLSVWYIDGLFSLDKPYHKYI